MTDLKILFSNLGYARGIDGSLWHHVSRFGRHFYCRVSPQQQVLNQLKDVMNSQQPDLCCFVEIDKGAFHSSYFNQMDALRDDDYLHHDMANKYGEHYWLSRMPFHGSKSNGFLAKERFPFDKLFFKAGRKRLIYRIELPQGINLYFAHFSLQEKVRIRQFQELGELILKDSRPSIILADFNIFGGFREISDLITSTGLTLLNRENEFTFTFHRKRHVLDLCLCSGSLAEKIDLKIIPQPYSDHAALFLTLKDI